MIERRILIYAALFASAIIVQKSLVPIFFAPSHLPDLVLMLMLALAIIRGFDAFFFWAIAAGVAYDLASHSVVGLHALVFVLVLYGVSFFSRRFLVDMRSMGVTILAFFVLLATLLSHLLIALGAWLDSGSAHNFAGAFGNLGNLAMEVAYNGIIFMVIFLIVRKVNRKNNILIRQV